MKKQCVCVFFFFSKCIRFVEGRTPTFAYNCIPGERRDTWLARALRDNESVQRTLQKPEKGSSSNSSRQINEMKQCGKQNDLTDHPLVQWNVAFLLLFSIPSSLNKLANYVQGALPQNLCYTNRVVAGPWKSSTTEINYGNRFIRSLSTIKPWQY